MPEVSGPARYEDRDHDGRCGAGDVLIVPFNRDILLSGATISDLRLTDEGEFPDDFGADPTLTVGPGANELTIALGNGARMKTRQAYAAGQGDLDPASGIELVDGTGIRNALDGSAAGTAPPVDVLPGFVDSGQALGNDPTRAVALGDLDGDGDLDLVEGNDGGPNWIRWNEGGAFGAPAQQVGDDHTRTLLLVDVDGDADLDLVIGNADHEGDELWRNEEGTFRLRQVFGACDTWAFASGDLDRDGDPDLVTADGTAPNVVWENREGLFFLREELSDDAFCPPSDAGPGGCPTRAVALADLDRDGRLDLVEGNWNEPDLVRYGVDGGFGAPASIGVERGATCALALGDLDLDGDLDLVTGDGQEADRLWLNVDGAFADSGQRLGHDATRALLLADFDQDGALDLVTAGRGAGNRFWRNDHRGTLEDSGQALGTSGTEALASGDIDGDGDLDLVFGNAFGANRVWLQSLAGTWGTATLLPSSLPGTPTCVEVSAADLDRDGDLDLVLARGGGTNSVWHGDGAGRFVLVQNLSPTVTCRSIAVGDLDGDGNPDLVESLDASGASKKDRVWINDGRGLFALSETLEFQDFHSPLVVALQDLDANGALDYVSTSTRLTGTNSHGVSIWFGRDTTEEVGFTLGPQTLGSGRTKALALGDLDGNGLADMVEAFGSAAKDGRIWLNGLGANPPGVFSSGDSLVLAAIDAKALALGDVDRDGDLDLVSTDEDNNDGALGNRVWLNDGSGTFVDLGQRLRDPPGVLFVSLVLVDLDGDGDLDVVAGEDRNLHAGFLNDGSGIFGPLFRITGDQTQLGYASGLMAADIDRDGDVDILAALLSGSVEAWFNR